MTASSQHYFLVAAGSAGDVFPLITLGTSLSSRGHRVTLVAHVTYSGIASRNGIEFVALSDKPFGALEK